jgi:hypothetical protein
MRVSVALAAVFVVLLVAPSASSHIRYWGTNCGPENYCEYFNGNTVEEDNINNEVDPINIVWYCCGSWDPNVRGMLENEMGWTNSSGSGQRNYRLVGNPQSQWFEWRTQTGSRADGGFPGSRWHARVFLGHTHDSWVDNWSVSDAHHEDWNHDIDTTWQDAEEHVRVRLAVTFGRSTTANWTYLPRANRCWPGGGGCYNGWPANIYGW